MVDNSKAREAWAEFGAALQKTTDQLMDNMRQAGIRRWQGRIDLLAERIEQQGLLVAVDLESATASVRKQDCWTHHCTIDYGVSSPRACQEIYNWLEGHLEPMKVSDK